MAFVRMIFRCKLDKQKKYKERTIMEERLYLINRFVPSRNGKHIAGKLDEVEYIYENAL